MQDSVYFALHLILYIFTVRHTLCSSSLLVFQLSFCCQPSVLVQFLQIPSQNYWSLQSTWSGRDEVLEAKESKDGCMICQHVITESMKLAEIVLTFQSCVLLSREVSYGLISLRDRSKAFGTYISLLVYME